ncbi:MAG: DUF4350 domain-containing protein [Planctomycetes bacterium]|nr:DUF4350 domain-containing protein [Planctomycetota bacterium]
MRHETTKIAKRLKTAEPGVVDVRMRWLFIAVMAAVTLFMILRGVFEDPETRENFTNSGSPSPGGHRALVELLQKSGFKVETTVARLDRLDDEFFKRGGRTLALLEPSGGHVEEHEAELRALFEDERKANIILVLPKRHYSQVETEDGESVVLQESIGSLEECRKLLELAKLDGELEFHRATEAATLTDGEGKLSAKLGGKHPFPQYFVLKAQPKPKVRSPYEPEPPPRWQVLVKDSAGNPVALRNNERNLVVLAEPDLISNRFLGEGEAAALAKIVMNAGNSRSISIDEALHGLSTQASLEYLAVRPPALWALLSLLLLLGLFFWREATVLRPLEAESDQRRSRALVIEGVARLMARARDYGPAARAVIHRAPYALQSARAQVHAAGIAGSTPKGVPREIEQRLEAIGFAGGSEGGLIQAAAAVSSLKREVSLAKHVPTRNA